MGLTASVRKLEHLISALEKLYKQFKKYDQKRKAKKDATAAASTGPAPVVESKPPHSEVTASVSAPAPAVSKPVAATSPAEGPGPSVGGSAPAATVV
jgi:hypothetical protein